MIRQPHALFHLQRFGFTLTVEINSRKPAGSSGGRPMYEVLSISTGPNPFWRYECGFSEKPIWNDPFGHRFLATDADAPSYVRLLRMAVCMRTGGSSLTAFSRPRLGFHAKYHAVKRARANAA